MRGAEELEEGNHWLCEPRDRCQMFRKQWTKYFAKYFQPGFVTGSIVQLFLQNVFPELVQRDH